MLYFFRGLLVMGVLLVSGFPFSSALSQNVSFWRHDFIVVEQNQAVTAAMAGKLPSKWYPAVKDLFDKGHVLISSCREIHVRFSHLNPGVAIPAGPYRFEYYDRSSRKRVALGEAAVYLAPAGEDSPGWFFHEMRLSVSEGTASVHLPTQPFLDSSNPTMSIGIDGVKLLGLPEGNNTGRIVSTPRNDAYKTENIIHQAIHSKEKSKLSILVVPPGACVGGRP